MSDTGCGCNCQTIDDSGAGEWSYTNQDNWSSFTNFYNALRIPLNINTEKVKKSKNKLKIVYSKTQSMTSVSDVHFVKYYTNTEDSYIIYENNKYLLRQFHFHNSSENLINNVLSPVECHFVHENVELKKLVVIGVLMKLSSSGSDITQNLISNIGKTVTFDLSQYNKLYKNKYYSFLGSLTTPPFDIGIQWLLFNSTDIVNNINLTITEKDWIKYGGAFPNNRSNTVSQYNKSRFQNIYNNNFAITKIN